MELDGQRVLITGGAGFIGSHVAELLLHRHNDVFIADDFSNSTKKWVPKDADVIEADLTKQDTVEKVVTDDLDIVFHLAARKDPNDDDPQGQFSENTTMTHLLLEQCRTVGVDQFAFASSSTVYGEAPRPTPEDYAPLEPISVYGASKLGEEGLVSTYAHSHKMTTFIFRFANIVGPRLRGAVIPDFIEKLRADPDSLTILGNGRQEKSYMHVTDCVNAMCYIVENATERTEPVHTFNLGTKTTTSVDEIAEIVSDVLDMEPSFEYTGGDRGWTGDVPKMRLSVQKLTELGWEPNHTSSTAVRKAAEELEGADFDAAKVEK
ncbi:NAD-dependent epimerase/dehydratase family protein [Natranaeroarchaeum sulfidigenes]|uniref:Nucleoside-diphosphate-sugar epimerase n=1 Tax=Natranaeroarchaeum sulfidigenes TaxID=2784880 RepID=A0A897MMR9_9EURY|nr:NAD-dependent epimerase/dehydratase family protein [Natranaeroarchaeum sulfidigenes]QSG01702.1 Nucleoside-diphosphate-sugar epimerase [Natranaeroarchaeum sulfidigenes]